MIEFSIGLLADFDWEQGMMALVITAMVLAGLVMVEAVHQPRGRGGAARGQAPAASGATAPVRWGWAMLAGLFATAVMSGVMAIMDAAGLPKLDPAASLAGFMKMDVVLGWLAHFMIGAILAMLYALLFAGVRWQRPWLRGTAFGILPFLAAQAIVVPLMGGGLFSTQMAQMVGEPVGLILLVSLVGHLVYGAVVGWIYGDPYYGDDAL